METEIKGKVKMGAFAPDHQLIMPGELGAILEWEVKDENGSLMVDPRTGRLNHGKRKSESFVRQFLELMLVTFSHNGVDNTYPIRDTGNTVRGIYIRYYEGNIFSCDAGIGVVAAGIVAGTGSTAPTINDYKLETPIAHGVGGGQLSYAAMAFGLPTADAATSHYTLTRNISNNSPGAITVNELGLYVEAYDGSTRYFMIIRDVIGGGIAIPVGQTLTANYRPIATV